MCSIIGSFDKETFKHLVDINQFRGNFSYSLTSYDFKTRAINTQVKEFGEFNDEVLNTVPGYYLGHLQAPTGGLIRDINRIHPTNIDGSMLWHNGIITPRGIKFLQELLGITETFDTYLLHAAINKFGFEILSEIEGLFACVYIKEDIFIFRTKHAKLYVDKDLDLSSERFEKSTCINYDTVYKLSGMEEVCKFKTLRYNIVVPGEM